MYKRYKKKVQKVKDFINTKLLNAWSAEQLRINKIAYPVSECICTRWMKEAGFKYEKYKNVIMLTGIRTKM